MSISVMLQFCYFFKINLPTFSLFFFCDFLFFFFLLFFFFFSSRRRHTRSLRDWSSDVCSSDLHACKHLGALHVIERVRPNLGSLPAEAVFGVGLRRVAPARYAAAGDLFRHMDGVASEVHGIVSVRAADCGPAAHALRDDEELPGPCRRDERGPLPEVLVAVRRAPGGRARATMALVRLSR